MLVTKFVMEEDKNLQRGGSKTMPCKVKGQVPSPDVRRIQAIVGTLQNITGLFSKITIGLLRQHFRDKAYWEHIDKAKSEAETANLNFDHILAMIEYDAKANKNPNAFWSSSTQVRLNLGRNIKPLLTN